MNLRSTAVAASLLLPGLAGAAKAQSSFSPINLLMFIGAPLAGGTLTMSPAR